METLMTSKVKFKAGLILASIATLSLAPISAHAHNTGFGHGHQSSNGGNQLAGAVFGAATGALLGSAVAGRGNGGEGALIGAALGGVTGAAITGSRGLSLIHI